jgi:hypothetical protein
LGYLGAEPITAEYYFDVYDGDGTTNTWPTTIAPATPVSVIVTVDGTIVDPQGYYFEGSNIYFLTPPSTGSRNIQLRYLSIPTSGVAAPHTYRQVDEFVATEGQTNFSIRYYDLGYVDVYVNGVQLGNMDYQASDGETIILQVGARKGDLVRVVSAYNTVLTVSTVNAAPNVVLLGNGLNSFQEVYAGTTGNVLMSVGDTWVSKTINVADIFDQSAFDHANSAYAQANTATNNAESASLYANTGINNAASASLYANTGINNAASASEYANAGITLAQTAYNQGNSTAIVANTAVNNAASASDFANTGINNAASASLYANTGINNAASASAFANAAFEAANAAANLVPQNAQSATYALVRADAGKHIYFTNSSATSLFIPNNGQVNWTVGTTIALISRTSSSANVTITPNTGVSMFLAANTTASSRVLVTYGMATIINTGANTWFINGTGVV